MFRHFRHKVLVSVFLVTLFSCGGGYQAPVSEQGERQVINAPIIVSSNTPDADFRVQESRASVVGANNQSARRNRVPVVSASAVSGERSNIMSGQTHRVVAGENLMSIAFQYDLDFRALARANGLNPPYTIFVDQEINLDVGRVVDSQTSRNSQLGTAVANNAVARSQGTLSRAGGLLRQAIGSAREPNWQWPHDGRVLRGFQGDVNKGIDIGGQVGDPVLAASGGDVVYSGRGVQGSGNLIIIRHSDKYLSAYAHNSAMLVGEGSRVSAGEKIAEVGQNPSGTAMLHFEIRVDGQSVDPTGLLPRR
ncbi:MAG: peptidoglycan DD-metalloendopeptidase family protein [Gammaproteobacteria bacterium]|nr:peptidoglycan DD-metalloendopeptidase family protein [Gammaproteobacteria bacterium]MDD9957742.1 peptidoglycan DD-metalloendopeptidase family protein [Gammaproteobacteria bacterium]